MKIEAHIIEIENLLSIYTDNKLVLTPVQKAALRGVLLNKLENLHFIKSQLEHTIKNIEAIINNI